MSKKPSHPLLPAALLALAALAATAQEPPADPAPGFQPLASPYGELQTAQDVAVTMRDGVALSLDIYRPDDNRAHPTLYAAGPFPHTAALLADSTSQVGPVAWYVSQGYAVVVASVRGTGQSGGDFTFFDRVEQQDHYEIIEWIAQQPWSNGQVAGTGAGYYAASQWQMAIQGPPHLGCIAPVNGVLDPFREWVYPGGLANNAFINDWYDRQVRLANAYAPGAARLVTFDMRLAQLAHPVYDDFWQLRSGLVGAGQIGVPVYVLHDWSLDAREPGITATFQALRQLNVTNKILVSNGNGVTPIYQDTALLARELMPFYTWCLNGRSTTSAFVELPRIRFQVRGQNTLKRESTWPPGNIAQQEWFLGSTTGAEVGTGTLARDAGAGPVLSTLGNGGDALVRFVSAPLAADLEITGPVMLELYAASSAADAAFEVTLKEELVYRPLVANPLLPTFLAPDVPAPAATEASTLVTVTRGVLKASARQRDAALSGEYSPVYALAGGETLNPGQVYRLDIALRQTAYRFTAGNRLVLEVRPVDDGSLPRAPAITSLYHTTRYPSRLWLPAVRSPQALTTPAPLQPAMPEFPGFGDDVPAFDFLDPEALDALNGDEQDPVIFVPR